MILKNINAHQEGLKVRKKLQTTSFKCFLNLRLQVTKIHQIEIARYNLQIDPNSTEGHTFNFHKLGIIQVCWVIRMFIR